MIPLITLLLGIGIGRIDYDYQSGVIFIILAFLLMIVNILKIRYLK